MPLAQTRASESLRSARRAAKGPPVPQFRPISSRREPYIGQERIMSGPPPAPQKRTPGEARHESWETIQVMFWDTLPFLAAAVLVGVVHTVREVAMPDSQATWMRIVVGALVTSEVVLF